MRLLSVTEAAARTNQTGRAVRQKIHVLQKRGIFVGHKVGNQYVILESELHRLERKGRRGKA